MKIGILGGTFNPFHKGHLNIVKNIRKELGLDQVWIIPTFITADKTFMIENLSANERYKIIKYTLKKLNINWLKISKIEINEHKVSYTYETLKKLNKLYLDHKFYFIMGEDRYKFFHKWYQYEKIQDFAIIVVYRRLFTGSIHNEHVNEKYIEFFDDIIYDISSRDILQYLKWSDLLKPTKKYIAKHYYYLKTITFYNLKFKRYQHSISVASHAKRLAKRYHYKNWKRAYYAGLVHDLFKYHDNKKLVSYVEGNLKPGEEMPPIPALHGYAAAFWLKYSYKINDAEFVNAVKNHTTACKKMTKLDKIIYVADKISSDRKGREVGHLRKQAYRDLNLTFKKLLERQIKHLEEKGIPFEKLDKNTKEAYERYVLNLKNNKQIEGYKKEQDYENKWDSLTKINR